MNIGIIGSGEVGRALAVGFDKEGYNVVIGTRDTTQPKLVEFIDSNPKIGLDSVVNVATNSDIIVLATKGEIAEMVIKEISNSISGKTIIDVTNPILLGDNGVPVIINGVISYFTDINQSLMERLQSLAPEANFVKAFNSIGNSSIYKPNFSAVPTMFICGNNETAKSEVKTILTQFGWETSDLGMVQSARCIESLDLLHI
jgi:8-hydroxy-5-deazaflavin:NADPH oxidoreductase